MFSGGRNWYAIFMMTWYGLVKCCPVNTVLEPPTNDVSHETADSHEDGREAAELPAEARLGTFRHVDRGGRHRQARPYATQETTGDDHRDGGG